MSMECHWNVILECSGRHWNVTGMSHMDVILEAIEMSLELAWNVTRIFGMPLMYFLGFIGISY